MSRIKAFLLGIPLTVGAMLSLAALAFSGMWIIHPQLVPAVASACFAAIIEGEVYGQNITSGIQMLFNWRYFIAQTIAQRELHDMVKCAETESKKSHILREYHALQIRLKQLQHYDPDDDHTLGTVSFYWQRLKRWWQRSGGEVSQAEVDRRQEIMHIKQALAEIEALFLGYVQQEQNDKLPTYSEAMLEELTAYCDEQKRLSIAREIKTKQAVIVATTMIIGLPTAVAESFITLGQLHGPAHVLLYAIFGSAALGPGALIPLAIVAGIAFGMIVSKSIAQIILTDMVQQTYRNLKAYLTNPEKSFRQKAGVVIGVTALSAFVILATVFSAGTCWYFGKIGFRLLPWSKPLISAVMGVFLPASVIGEFAFNGSNCVESSEEIIEAYAKRQVLKEQAVARLKDTWQQETWGQRLNPFRLIFHAVDLLWKSVVFLLHVVSYALTGDRFPHVSTLITMTVNSTVEFWGDLHYIADKFEDEHDHDHGHDHEEDHSHYILNAVSLLIKLPLLPILCLSCLWHESFKPVSSKVKAQGFGFRFTHFWQQLGQSCARNCLQSLGIKKPHPGKKPDQGLELSPNLTKHCLDRGIQAEQARLNRRSISSYDQIKTNPKIQALKDLSAALPKQHKAGLTTAFSQARASLVSNRSAYFHRATPKSAQHLDQQTCLLNYMRCG